MRKRLVTAAPLIGRYSAKAVVSGFARHPETMDKSAMLGCIPLTRIAFRAQSTREGDSRDMM